jgi:hypothetical protein
MTIDRGSWGYRRNADLSQYYSIEELLEEVVYTIRYNIYCGNILYELWKNRHSKRARIISFINDFHFNAFSLLY